ncbi:uncharacterized protein PV09_08496 [Verruconis gallopava]|uniref:alpha-1,2-Mannosidase n=1 Tax=Verruconis gallopava TaxID=253628 RepID=A0A0D1YGA7_9PEZI|nr:uncharacterized protein PV09_08496 [Verruconis gallopava]KIV99826.1 hypothetical protein PV09_08496 [Verruconis gallopava]
MMRYRRYRAFFVLAAIAVLAFYHFGSRSPQVDYLKQQLNLRNHKADYSTSANQHAQQGVLKGGAPPRAPNPADGSAKSGTLDFVGDDDAAVAGKLTPPPVGDVEKPVQNIPPEQGTKTNGGKEKGSAWKPAKTTKAAQPHPGEGSRTETTTQNGKDIDGDKGSEDGERVRVMPHPIPADSFQKVRPLLEQGEGRWEDDQVTLDTPPVSWEKPVEHFPIADKDVTPLPKGKPKQLPKIQASFSSESVEQKKDRLAKQDVIKEAFLHAWGGYKAKAWGHDEIKPLSGTFRDPFNGWGATLVDSLDLIWMMGLKDEFEAAVDQVAKINFKTSRRSDIPLFETTIRYLGGLLGAYDVSGGQYRVLLDKAAELAEILIGAFDTPNRMPDLYYQWKPAFTSQSHRASKRVVLAELGSLALEFTRLAQLTKEPRYYDAIARITDALEEWQDHTRLPGMWPSSLDASGCSKRPLKGASIEQIANDGSLDLLDSKGNPLEKAGKDESKASKEEQKAGLDSAGMTSKESSKTTTSNRDEDELEGVEVKQLIKSGKAASEKSGPNVNLATTSDRKSGAGVTKGQTSDYAELSGKEETGPKLPPPKKQGGSEEAEYVPLKRPEPVTFKIDGGKKDKRQLKAPDVADVLSALPARDADSSTPEEDPSYKRKGEPVANIPSQLPFHKHDGVPLSTLVEEEDEICVPTGLQSQATWGTDLFTLGSQADSTYEYLPKMYLMLNGLVPKYRTMYEKAIDAAKEHLLFRVMIPDEKREVLVSGEYAVTHNVGDSSDGGVNVHKLQRTTGSHLTCFVGGMFGLGGKLFGRKDDLQLAQKLTDGCVWAYESTATGIMPETFHAVACDDRRDCPWNETKWWAVLDPDMGEWRNKNYESSMKYYYAQLEAREKEIQEIRAKSATSTAHVTEETALPESGRLRSHSDMEKRQLKDPDGSFNGDANAPLKPAASAYGKVPEEDAFVQAAHAQDAYEEAQIKKQLEIAKGTPTQSREPETTWEPPTLTEDDLPPIHSPEKPLSHEEFAKTLIKEDRLPDGIQAIHDRRYILRPEALESVFYMHRITGSPYWRRAGWNMISAILKHTRTELAHSAIDDVTKKFPKQTDSMESFWLAETLKYAWLLFEEEDKWSLDEWVFNTEAHPLRRMPADGVPDGGVASKAGAAEEVKKTAEKSKEGRVVTHKSDEDMEAEMRNWST